MVSEETIRLASPVALRDRRRKGHARRHEFHERIQRDLARPVLTAKINRWPRRANQIHNSRHPVPPEGRRPSSQTWGRERGTRGWELRAQPLRTAKSFGPV